MVFLVSRFHSEACRSPSWPLILLAYKRHPYHFGDFKGFRSSVSGTEDKNQIYISYCIMVWLILFLCSYVHILKIYQKRINKKVSLNSLEMTCSVYIGSIGRDKKEWLKSDPPKFRKEETLKCMYWFCSRLWFLFEYLCSMCQAE